MLDDMTHRGHSSPESIDLQALEQFATSIAALAREEVRPADVLENVLCTIAENLNASRAHVGYDKHHILREKAQQVGYYDYQRFEEDLLHLIGARINDLRTCHLTAIEREQKRLIATL